MTGMLFAQFAVSTTMLVLCVVIHGLGLFSLSRAIRTEANQERLSRMTPLSTRGELFTLAVVLALISLHGVEIWAYALTYMAVGAVPRFEDALYFSTISYSTVGYNDAHVAADWRLLGAFESILA